MNICISKEAMLREILKILVLWSVCVTYYYYIPEVGSTGGSWGLCLVLLKTGLQRRLTSGQEDFQKQEKDCPGQECDVQSE